LAGPGIVGPAAHHTLTEMTTVVSAGRRATPYLAFVAAWTPFVLLWTFFAAGQRGAGSALASGAIGVAPAALLSVVVWRVCARFPWPARLTASFYLTHLSLATAYAVTWVLATRALRAAELGELIPREFLGSRLVLMQLLTGIALYGVIAGVSYAIQISEQLRDKEQLAERARTLVVSARFEALRARLNPHFLFNAMHTLAALIRYDPPVAEQAVERLAEMLRYALRADGDGVVAFLDEWEFTMRYLEFQKLRFGERLRVEADPGGDTKHWRVPVFAVQALVENAVRHAVEQNPNGGAVFVSSVVEDGRLNITVRDEGAGRAGRSAHGSGSGLKNLRERLAVLYDGSASIEQQPTASGGFQVRLTLPARRQDGTGPEDE
jgi:hypothetical protein